MLAVDAALTAAQAGLFAAGFKFEIDIFHLAALLDFKAN
jgi:hypothetical protein